ncbi:MrcB family domain-containing protein [Glycomyces tenuis]|uniref:MrcB family domain-containing protein n=1 Tax=Glycomyces tenuis TaxID=58116 RepID=UPI0003F5AA67|nr:DUF3578 domain-containing protein [Glycomyces tenuis]
MIRTLLAQVGTADYNREGNKQQPIFQTLQGIVDQLYGIAPSHYTIKHSTGVGSLPLGLWVAILDPDVTSSPTRGVYVVFLFNTERTQVSLSLNQGVTVAPALARERKMTAKQLLRNEAQAVRDLLDADTQGLATKLILGAGDLVSKYEAGNIYARTWELSDLPSDEAIAEEVRRFLDLYTEAVEAKKEALTEELVELPEPESDPAPKVQLREFKPKDDADYRVHIRSTVQKRKRSHETLVGRLGTWASPRGFEPNTRQVHPRDLVLHQQQGPDCLVEVKVFPAGKPHLGLRECIGQLLEYRHFLADPDTILVAALSEYPGPAYVEFLTTLEIATIWPTGPRSWQGCEHARALGLVD